MRKMRRAALLAAMLPLLAVMALLAPSASAAANVAVRPASHASAEPAAPDAPFPSCADYVTVTRLGKGSSQVKVVVVGFSGGTQHKLWLTDVTHGELYPPVQFGSSINKDYITNTTSPVNWAVEVTTLNSTTLCASDYYA